MIAGAGSYFENAMVGRNIERLGHEANDVGLRDGLGVADGQRPILVRLGAPRIRHEEMARNLEHRAEDSRILDIAGFELFIDHPTPHGVQA